MADKIQNETLADSLNAKLEKSKGKILACIVVVAVVIATTAIFAAIRSKSISNGIEKIEQISFALTDKATELSKDELTARQNKALEELSNLMQKGGVVGLRANMLVADIKFAQKNYGEAKSAWLKAAELNKNAYTAPLCYYNAAVSSEELSETENAISYYKLASENEDFILIDHALFSLGRVSEFAQKYDDAKSAYEKLVDLRPSANWAQLAKSRLIALNTEGKIN